MITNYLIPPFGQCAQMRIGKRPIYTISSTCDYTIRMIYLEKYEYID